jgi:hypothetical protein
MSAAAAGGGDDDDDNDAPGTVIYASDETVCK